MKTIGAFLIFPFLCMATFFTDLEVEKITFEKNTISLIGPFRCTIPLGIIHAEDGKVLLEEGEKPKMILLRKEVDITLQDQGKITCSSASFDYQQGIGIFLSEGKRKAAYKKENFVLTSSSLQIQTNASKEKGSFAPKELLAEGDVEIDFPPSFHLVGDKALFSDYISQRGFSQVHLTSKDPLSPCLLSNLSQDRLETSAIHLNWEPEKNCLDTLSCEGPSKLVSKQGQNNTEHQLTVYGNLVIDHRALKMTMESPRTSSGEVEAGKQLHFQDALGEVFADRGILLYAFDEKRIVPKKLILEGNVKIHNHSSLALQYALADKAELNFDTNTLILSATQRPSVLFYDQLNKIEASAPTLQIKRDANTGKEIIQSQGNVRFIFAEDELNELKKRFSFHE